jgi:hypothetical protein
LGWLFSTNVDVENKTFGYLKTVSPAQNTTYWVVAFSGSFNQDLSICFFFFLH